MDYRDLFIWLLLIFCAQAAFIRRLPCSLEEDGSTDPLFEPLSLSGSLDSRDDGAALSIKLLGDFIDERCEELDGASAVLTLDARLLGRLGISGKPWAPEGRCPTLSPKDNPRYDRRTYAIYEASFPLEPCMRAHITPYLGSIPSRILMGVPLTIMLLSGIVTGALRSYQRRRQSTFRYELGDGMQDPAESTMPGLGPCIHYLQFIFLTGCLTLSYPGFFRAVVSSLSWSSLIFRNWPVTHQFTYPGVEDGIYSVNATYGLEEMAQYLGSTATSDLWTNSIVNLALLMVGVVVTILSIGLYRWLRQLYESQRNPDQAVDLQIEMQTLLHRIGWSFARLVLDYFLHPLIALSLFQTNNARWFPVTHTSTALIAVAILAGVLIVVVRRLVKTDRQAVFFQPTSLPCGVGSNHWGFYTLYGIPFVRGIAIGGLQLSGLAELVILLGCEVWILTWGSWNRQTGFTGRHALLSAARLAALGMSFVFLVEVGASERTKSIVAYCILSLHLTVLIIGIGLDCIYKPLGYLSYRVGLLDSAPNEHSRSKAPVFGIAQLSHRSTRRFSFAHLPALDPAPGEHPSPPYRRHSPRPGSSGSQFTYESKSFFRPPRCNAPLSSHNGAVGPTRSPEGSDRSSESTIESIELAPLDNIYEVINSTEYYSQRESDQFYRPRERDITRPRKEPCSEPEIPSAGWGLGPSKLLRWKRQMPKERGFEVIRPRATTPAMAPRADA
ncbi:hypothetical protein AN5367.2 [Aspergillus nidulans FGSC A4]|uniref:Integral membrane protein (AFU_orthologue AFUA_2G17475) n=1 Tax=Emericella nidulans (strain FGSC A4 / ATCC 38163 / CBS 112.46 / NRRL 194 / M139) TaxID=227321 RepID=Q5B263_EMENI|nr:hypothetical protein [Aspergillus nidulans FGSC A4]EAA62527.1 hypothetical protein AN5367.2 [Aspergillus nidulans FGSC A4]CBF82027.1 TPA: integral membrane protein (AFU_orthologue; AFUA_2G17475) [Aspergillus nidulans FGSC A4]|eukprot:XP_662971.1 hypothetical protein AN5367.2 [Aspergillus nidulans FGSC A4]